ncbi:EamA family transporter [Caenimonas terrae]|uniref:EamA family transporter n=1 Tax=Caenimonas terrae TaxID=696074 RepID=A0ABW0NFD5_9BURK
MTSPTHRKLPRGVAAALLAALLFGAGTPAAKVLLAATSPWLLAALLYLGSGLGLLLWRRLRGAAPVRLPRAEWPWLAGAVLAGGVAGPVLLMVGLNGLAASTASLLLNAEGVFTALLAWTVFRENVDRRVALGMAAIVAGGVVLSWPGRVEAVAWLPALCVAGACAAWAVDNNLTRKVSLNDASWLAMVKGLAAGSTNLALALVLGAHWPSAGVIGAAALLGFASYGASLMLFVVALRELGTGRTGAYFSVAPFFGAVLAILFLGDPMTPQLLAAGTLMAIGVALHLSERHQHAHRHEPLAHGHAHVHGAGDEHHEHVHVPPVPPGTRHAHWHEHTELAHSHPHYPDAHHRHEH